MNPNPISEILLSLNDRSWEGREWATEAIFCGGVGPSVLDEIRSTCMFLIEAEPDVLAAWKIEQAAVLSGLRDNAGLKLTKPQRDRVRAILKAAESTPFGKLIAASPVGASARLQNLISAHSRPNRKEDI